MQRAGSWEVPSLSQGRSASRPSQPKAMTIQPLGRHLTMSETLRRVWPLRLMAATLFALGLVPMANIVAPGRGLQWWGQSVRLWSLWAIPIATAALLIARFAPRACDALPGQVARLVLRPSRPLFMALIGASVCALAVFFAWYLFRLQPLTIDELSLQWHGRLLATGRLFARAVGTGGDPVNAKLLCRNPVQFDPSLAFRNSSRTREYADRGPAQNVEPSGRTIPAGAELVVRTNQDIRSTTAEPNRYYSAVVERDVMDSSGQVVIPRGSEAQLVIRDVPAGSSHQLTLDLQSVSVNGSTYYLSTEDLQRSGRREGLGSNRRTAEIVGGGAALGTLLGAIAGGGRGAAIGAVAGAATGAGVQVLTRGKEVRVPAETVLTFRLDQPLQLNAAR